MKLKVLAVLISAVVFANVAGAAEYGYQRKINLGILEAEFSANQTIFEEAERLYALNRNDKRATGAYVKAQDNLKVAGVTLEEGKVLFKSFLNLLGRLSFAKAQGKKYVSSAIREDLVNNYLEVNGTDITIA
jgi:hypothetical protein